jgi:hypothetical protein
MTTYLIVATNTWPVEGTPRKDLALRGTYECDLNDAGLTPAVAAEAVIMSFRDSFPIEDPDSLTLRVYDGQAQEVVRELDAVAPEHVWAKPPEWSSNAMEPPVAPPKPIKPLKARRPGYSR